jgi:putative membrane protein
MSPFRACVFVTLMVSASSCRLLRPIDPNPPRQKLPESEPVAEAARPMEQPVDTVRTEPQPVRPVETVVAPPVVITPTPAPAAAPVATPVETRPAPIATPPVVEPSPQPVATPVRRGAVRDPNIAAMVLASNNTDISYARLVPARAQHADVKKFAERMLTDHNGVNSLIHDLIRSADLTPEDNEISLDMRDESANKRDILRELSGFAFDSTYMENEVSYHRNFLSSIDNVMLPSVRSPSLRDLLNALRPAVAAHLAHAEQVRATVLMKK